METREMLAEHDVTADRLRRVFVGAAFRATLTDSDEVGVASDGPAVWVRVDGTRRLLTYSTICEVQPSAPLDAMHARLAGVLDGTTLLRVAVPDSSADLLYLEYSLLYEDGIPVSQVLSALRRFRALVEFARSVEDGCPQGPFGPHSRVERVGPARGLHLRPS